jgi:hypothetical protein
MLFAMWKSNPSDDVDYGPLGEAFTLALLIWVAVTVALFVTWLLVRAAKKEAALRAGDR